MAPSGRGAQQVVEDPGTTLTREAAPDGARLYLATAAPAQAPPDVAEQRLQTIEAQARDLARAVSSTRAMLARIERRLSELKAVEARIATLQADLEARERPARRVSRKQPCPLSSRELEVLMALADGKVYKQIARDMSLSVSTVRSHLHHAYAKLGVPDRAQAVLLASKHGWI